MSIKRYAGSGFTEVSTRKRWNGSSWVDLTVGKRWNGAAWVDLWSASGGSGSSGSASGSGWLVKNALSSASSPHVHYSAQYAAQRDGGAVAVTLTFAAWLNSSASRLGSGIRLTVFARVNGGAWSSVVIKESSAVWSGVSSHSASLTLSGNAAGNAVTVDFYVSRAGSSYGGSAGKLGSASSPKSYRFSMS